MSILNEVLSAVVNMAQSVSPAPYAAITVGALPADNGLAMIYSTGAPAATALDKGMAWEMPVVLNGKHTSQEVLSECLNTIHAALTRTKSYPRTDDWQITDIETIAAPAYLDREENSQWLYGSSLRVKFYYF